MKRSDLTTVDYSEVEHPEEYHNVDEVKDFIDDIETRVNEARDKLKEFKVTNPEALQEAFELLEELSKDLY